MGGSIEEGGFCRPPKATEGEKKMRTIAMMMALSVALLAVSAGAVFAANQVIRCAEIPCVASGNDDLVFERRGVGKNDRILLKGGNDEVRANTYGADKDVIKGGAGFDVIYVTDEDTLDRIYGGKGNDKCYVNARSEVVSGCSRIIVRR
jgi:Ca2+-binding RTX toxin-like protein